MLGLLALVSATAATASPLVGGAWPFEYDWTKFPAAWFGGNATNFESDAQLEEIGKYSLAILGWQHLITATNWTASVYEQMDQAAIIKKKFPKMPVYVYTGFGNADGYNNHTWQVMKGASDGCPDNQPCRVTPAPYTDWFLQAAKTPVYSMSACEQMGLGYSHPPTDKCWNPIWNVGNPKVRDFYIDNVIAPLAASDKIDGVFFDCFNFAYDMTNPWGRNAVNIPNCTHNTGGPGCQVLLDGAIDMAARTAKALNAGGKVPMFSNPASFVNGPKPQPIWLNETKLVEGLKGTTYQFNYECVELTFSAALQFGKPTPGSWMLTRLSVCLLPSSPPPLRVCFVSFAAGSCGRRVWSLRGSWPTCWRRASSASAWGSTSTTSTRTRATH
jgi:hypothetical protein